MIFRFLRVKLAGSKCQDLSMNRYHPSDYAMEELVEIQENGLSVSISEI